MIINTTYRSDEQEIMDDFELTGALLENTLHQLDRINKWLGGNQVTLSGLDKLWRQIPKDQSIRILDLGCGSGDMLRLIAKKAKNEKRKVELIGIDANEFVVEVAINLSKEYDSIQFRKMMIPSPEFDKMSFDIVLSTLFLHHFKDQEIISLLSLVKQKARLGIIVNDLHRNSIAYYLFYLLSRFVRNEMVQKDGLTSILRAFKKKDLLKYSDQIEAKNSSISWKWAFRYQWIIKC